MRKNELDISVFCVTCQDAARLEHARVRAVRELLGEVERFDRPRLGITIGGHGRAWVRNIFGKNQNVDKTTSTTTS